MLYNNNDQGAYINHITSLINKYKDEYKKTQQVNSHKLYNEIVNCIISNKMLIYRNVLNMFTLLQYTSIILLVFLVFYVTYQDANIAVIYKNKYIMSCIILVLCSIFITYYIKDLLYIEQLKCINNLKLSLIYILLNYSSYSYMVSNIHNIISLIDMTVDAIKKNIESNTSNKIDIIIHYIIYTMIILLIIFVFITVVPLVTFVIKSNKVNAGAAAQNDYNNSIAKYAKIIGIMVLCNIVIFIYVHWKFKQKTYNNTEIDLKISSIHKDLLSNYETLYQYNAYSQQISELNKYYSIHLQQNINQSKSHLALIYVLLLPIVIYIFIIVVVQASEITSLHGIIDSIVNMNIDGKSTTSKTNKGNVKNLIALVVSVLMYTVVLVFLMIGNIINYITYNIQYSKYLSVKRGIIDNSLLFIIKEVQWIPKHNIINKTTDENGLILNDLTLAFGTKSIFNNVNIKLKPGNHYFITGASGSGKSSLFLLLLGLQTPTSGDIFINQQNILLYNGPQRLGIISYMAQFVGDENTSLVDHLNMKYDIVDSMILSTIQTITKDIISPRTKIRIGCLLYDIFMHENTAIVIMDEPFAGVNDQDAQVLKKIILQYIYSPNRIIINSDHSTHTLSLSVDNILYLGKTSATDEYSNIHMLSRNSAISNTYINQNIPGLIDEYK